MNLVEIKKLIEIFNHSEITRLSLKQNDFELKLDKQPVFDPAIPSQIHPTTHTPPQPIIQNAPQIPTPSAPCSESGDFITSPMVGTFYRCPSPDSAPYVNVGDTIKKGQTIGIIEAMKIMNEIEAEYDCKIISLEVNDAQPVEYGTKLIKVEKI
ncbi:acetyl-CoA carboxylase, biotin carboxyl carrier protein [Helicobacter sp. 12S02232-10]|uniref:acetyl-CoA carboxylase biotin carboxyl carrier protein n=1 Tax=Helicobacter sp. 12S02232-10 TaxID=1476197 RepID=UPI000BA776D7|nr:acetyl-CoA carboxylase biotin carboxyl carrier protein [Helicobacter sp. 12S02232-10]PAF49083.1 acetyl-CoA carboxylase, biotin carboxyl carrier protein [Helicobacter sp. 12S02232-10]